MRKCQRKIWQFLNCKFKWSIFSLIVDKLYLRHRNVNADQWSKCVKKLFIMNKFNSSFLTWNHFSKIEIFRDVDMFERCLFIKNLKNFYSSWRQNVQSRDNETANFFRCVFEIWKSEKAIEKQIWIRNFEKQTIQNQICVYTFVKSIAIVIWRNYSIENKFYFQLSIMTFETKNFFTFAFKNWNTIKKSYQYFNNRKFHERWMNRQIRLYRFILMNNFIKLISNRTNIIVKKQICDIFVHFVEMRKKKM